MRSALNSALFPKATHPNLQMTSHDSYVIVYIPVLFICRYVGFVCVSKYMTSSSGSEGEMWIRIIRLTNAMVTYPNIKEVQRWCRTSLLFGILTCSLLFVLECNYYISQLSINNATTSITHCKSFCLFF